jgi:hypothetical protein
MQELFGIIHLTFCRRFVRYFGHLVERLYFGDIFWLHIPGGGLFGVVFAIVAVRAFWEMYGTRKNYAQH